MGKAMGAIAGGLQIGMGILSEVASPGNPLGIMMIAQGVATEAGAIAQMLGSKTGLGVTTRTPAALRRVIRGEQRLGGTIVYQSTTGSTNRQYNLVIVFASHPVEAFVNLYLDGRQVYWNTSSAYNQTQGVAGANFGGNADTNNHTGPNGVQYNFGGLVFAAAFQGKQTSSPTVVSGTWVGPTYIDSETASYPGFCSALQANDSTWSPTAQGTPYLGGCSYLYLKIEADAGTFPQFPEIRCTIMGKNDIWDPRSSSRGYTTNAALHLADAITDPTWGLGDGTVNEDQLIAAANVCDEQVACQGGMNTWEPDTIFTVGQVYSQGGNAYTVIHNYTSGATFGATDLANTTESAGTAQTEAQFSLHWNYDSGTAPGEALQHMCDSKLFRMSRSGGEWYIFPPYWQGPSFSFDENALVGDVQWAQYRSIADLANRVTGTYIAPNYPYNIAGNLYDSNGFWNGQTQNNFPYSFQPTSFPTYACDVLHGYSQDVYLVADTPNQGTYASGTAYAAGAVVIYSGGLWQANEAVPAGNAPGTLDGSGNPYWSATGNYLPIDLNLDTTLSISEAQRLAKIALLRNRQQGAGTLMMNLAAFQMMALDVMTFTFPALSWSGKVLEVCGAPAAEMKLHCAPAPHGGEEGGDQAPALWLEVPVNETDPSVYEWDDATEELTPYDVPAYTGSVNMWTVAPPTGLTFESDASTAVVLSNGALEPRVLLSWTEPDDTYVTNGGSIQIQWQDAAGVYQGGAWIGVASVGGQVTSALFSVDASVTSINVQIAAVRPSGASSVWVELLAQAVGASGSVALAGTPTAPTAATGTNTTQIATTAFVKAAAAAAVFSAAPIALAAPATGTTSYTVGDGTPVTLANPAGSFYFVDGIKRQYGTYYSISGSTLTILAAVGPQTGDTHELYGS